MSFEYTFKVRLISLPAQKVLDEVNHHMKDFGFETDLNYGVDFGNITVKAEEKLKNEELEKITDGLKTTMQETISEIGVGFYIKLISTKEI